MNLPSRIKLNQKHKGEKGSVTLFVLIAMLFFLIIGMMIFIINMNAETSQKRDVEKIKREYHGNTSDSDLELKYQEAKQRQLGKFVIKVIDSYKEIYNSGEWINAAHADRLPLTIDANWPAGVASVEIVDHTGTGIRVNSEKALEDITFGKENTPEREGQYQITAKVDNNTDTVIYVNIDLTAPTTSIAPNGGTVWKGTEEEIIQVQDASNVITLTASDNVSGVKEIQYIINNSSETPAADAEWQTYNESSKPAINNTQENGAYYIHVRAIDNAGNISEVSNSEPYYVRQANYKVITATNGIRYAATLEEAAGIDGAEVIKVLRTFTDEVAATINKNVTLDTNGKTLTMTNIIRVAANKTMTFMGTGTIQRTTGTLISNSGTVIVNGATMNATDRVIFYGNVEVNSGKLNVTGASELTGNFAAIEANNITINGGEIINDYNHYGIIGKNTINITGGKVKGKNWGIHNGVSNCILNISGNAQIIGENNHGIISYSNNANITITGGTITGGTSGIHLYNDSNTVNITGGTIEGGTSGISIRNESSGHTVTIGDSSTAINRTSPVIQGTNGYGVNITNSTSTFNFYDGTIIGATKATAAENKRTFYGREVAFSTVAPTEEDEGTTVNFRDGYKPYTRQNTETNKWETVLEKQVNVTFNPGQGATVAENNRNVLTNVEYKEKAETAEIATLPTPTKTGYTFKGWNGKNLLNLQVPKSSPSSTTYSNSTKRIFVPNTYVKGLALNNYYDDGRVANGYIIDSNSINMTSQSGYGLGYVLRSEPNKNYVLSYSANEEKCISSVLYYKQDGELISWSHVGGSGNKSKAFKTPANTYYLIVQFAYNDTSHNCTFSNIMLEEGTTATAYEPYFVTDDTLVTQDTDHTLTAIWEANKYTVHFDGDGATGGTMADQSFEYDEEKALTQNAFTREHIVTYDGNEGTPAKANDTATYTFANWGNKDILGYDLDMSDRNTNGDEFDSTIYGNYNGYKTASVDNANGTGYKNIALWKVDRQFEQGDKYKLTFYAKGNGILTSYFYGGDYSKAGVQHGESSQGTERGSYYEDGNMPYQLTNEWTKYSAIYTMKSTTNETLTKNVLFRVFKGNSASIYGVRFEKIENDEHADQEVVSRLTADPNGTVTLYAVWTPHEVTLPSATREGYIFNGWYDATTGGNKIGNAGDKYIPEANITLHAQWRQVHYTVSVGEEILPAETLAEAVGLAEERITGSVTTATITPTINYADSSTVTISKNIVIDLAGHTITRDKTIVNNGTLEIKDTATGGTITGDGDKTITNNTGTLNVTGGTIIGSQHAIYVGGTATLTMGTNDSSVSKTSPEIISTATTGDYYGVYREENTTFNFYDGKITGYTGHSLNAQESAKPDGYQVVKRTADGKETAVLEKELTVTFEPNPGNTTGATVNPTSKTVLTNTAYGELPTPVKAGYTFNGWRTGKNLFNPKQLITENNIVSNEEGLLSATNKSSDSRNWSFENSNLKMSLPAGTYTLSLDFAKQTTNAYALLRIYDENGNYIKFNLALNDVQYQMTTFTLNKETNIGIGLKLYDAEVYMQLEEGTTATAYEPYYITATTTVEREDNHTLYADWTANPYTVTADANGGIITAANGWTVGLANLTANKDITYDTAYGILPTVARTGYTFDKWTGKNLFDKGTTAYKVNYYIKEDGTEENLSEYSEYKVNIKPNTTYTITNSGGSRAPGYVIFDAGGTRLAGEGYAYRKTVTFTTPNTASYIIFSVVKVRASSRYDLDTFQLEEGSTATLYEPYKTITAESILATDCDHKIYAQWTPRTDTAYTVNHYTHDIGTETYTLNSTDNLQGTSDAIVTLNNLKKTIAGYTYEEGFITGGTTKPDSGAVETTIIAADGNRVINLYYRPNYLYVQYHVNTGSMSDKHSSAYGVSGNLITNTGNEISTNFLSGVYGSKVGVVTLANYSISNQGLWDYNNPNINIVKTGYNAKGRAEWNTLANGTGESYNMSSSEYKAIDMATACGKDLSAGDQVITLYVNWEPISYTISYDLNNGTNNASNPTTYTIESSDITLQQPTRNGYTFTNWTEEVSDMYWIFGFVRMDNGLHEISSSFPNAYYTAPIKLKQGVTYTLSGYGSYAASNIRWRLYNLDGSYYKNGPSSNTYTADKDCYVRIMLYNNPTAEQRNGTKLTSSGMETIVIPQGSTGNRKYTANWTEKTYTLTIKPNGGTLDGYTTDIVRNLKYSDVSDINTPTKTGYTFAGFSELSGARYSNGLNSVQRYSNMNSSQITITSQAKSDDNPISGMSNELKITNAGPGETWPGLGGFLHTKYAEANKKYVHVFVAKLPEGYYFHNANNNIGTGGTTEWLTSNEGTGEWQTYVYKVNAGTGESFANFGYVYVSQDKDNVWSRHGHETGTFTAYLAYSNIYDITSDDSGIGQIDGTGVLTANWTANNYKVHFDKNDEGATGTMSDQAFTYDQAQNLTANAFSKTGYSFAGWATSAEGNIVHANEASVSNLTAEKNGTVTLYAKWTANPYTATAKANGGTINATEGWTGTGAEATKQVTYDSAYGTLPTAEKTGYTLRGWNGKNKFDYEEILSHNSSTVTQQELNGVQTISWVNNITTRNQKFLQGSFKENTQYIISGRIASSQDIRAAFHIFYKDGSFDTFDYPRLNADGGDANTFYNIKIVTSANKTIDYIKGAHSNSERIYIDINSFQIEEGTTATPYEPYLLATTTPVTTASNHDITAIWEANPYTVTANANGGTIPSTEGWTGTGATSTKSVTFDGQYGTLPTPTRDGYTFLGWYKENTFVNRVETTTQVTTDSDHTIYAYWTNFTLSKNPIYMNKTTTSIALIAPEGTSGATVTYTGNNIGELTFESENTNVATVQINADNTQAAITTAGGAQTGDTTKIIIKDRESGLLLGELNVIIDTELPTWLVRLLSIE